MNGTSGSDIASTRPDESRFERTVFADRLDEPIELDVTPNGRVVYIERYGDVHLYSPDRRKNMLLAELDVEAVFSNGLLGVTLDPNFETNRWVYLYYSPVTEGQKIQRLSRFKLRDNDLLLDTEQVIIEVPVQREYHAHTGGSLAFGPKGNLYVAVGDNVSPFTSGTRYPMDERPGKAPFDAQGTSLNTNNLNGKILRIRPDSGGGYTVPEGNLFPKGTPRTKPEIYVMGARNPYRLSVDHKTGFLYYGNMGGVDELHQVREPGLYGGWPYFYGDRQPYPRAEKMKEDSLNPDAPRNTSPNNTGRTTLPPVQPALLWYEKEHFPALPGEGGKGVVAGPVYHSDRYPESPRKFPDYYDGKLFFYDYVRDWIKIVHFDENHEFEGMEPFLPSTSFSSPIDMEFGPDGAMYLLEYGSTGYSQNPDARLSRIDYIRGNRPPEATLAASPRAGTAPLTVRLSATESFDYDEDDSLQYRWSAAASTTPQARGPETTFTFEETGVHEVTLVVQDPAGATDSATTEITVGNEPPTVEIDVAGNQSFYWDDRTLDYSVQVRDEEDGTVGQGIEAPDVSVTIGYRSRPSLTSSTATAEVGGQALLAENDCGTCHKKEGGSVGPSYAAIAERYGSDPPVAQLTRKVIEGGGGNWENTGRMPSHAALTEEEVRKMVEYIVSQDQEKDGVQSLPLNGTMSLTAHESRAAEGRYVLSASYTDRGSDGIRPFTGTDRVVLRRPMLEAEEHDRAQNAANRNMYVDRIQHGSYIAFDSVDVTGLSRVSYRVERKEVEGRIEVHRGSPEGPLLSEATVEGTGRTVDWRQELYTTSHHWTTVDAPLTPTDGVYDLYFVFKNASAKESELFNLDRIRLHGSPSQ